MNNNIIMMKYQGLGNDYLILDPNRNRVQLQGKRLLFSVREGLVWVRTAFFTDP